MSVSALALTTTLSPLAPSDEDLVARARQGDRAAFRVLVERYEDEVGATVAAMLGSSAEVDDVAQEVFIRFYRTLDRFRGEASVRTYLKRIAINRALDVLRRRKRNLARFFSRDAEVPPHEPPVDETGLLDARDRQRFVQRAIQTLPPKHRAVVLLRMIDGYSTEETAEMLGVPYGTVLSRLSRALATLKTTLAPYMQPPTSDEDL